MKTEIKANRRVYDITLSQKRSKWGSMKPWDGVVEVLIEYSRSGAWDFATLHVTWKKDGSVYIKDYEGTHRIAPTSLASLKKQLVEIIKENEEDIKTYIPV